MLTLVVLIVIAIIVAMLWNEGVWSNTITLFNIFFAGLIATNYYEPVANFLDKQAPSLTYFWDFLALWGVFAFTFAMLRELTIRASRTRVRFKLPVEQFGRILLAGAAAWVFISFMLFTLHTAPLARTAFGGSFAKTPTSNNFYLSPDRLWLALIHSRSQGALATSEPRVFDPQGEFILKYGERRKRFSQMTTHKVRRSRSGAYR